MKELQPDIVFVGNADTYDFNPEQWVKGGRRFIQSLEPSLRDIVVISGTPVLPFNGLTCAVRNVVQQSGWLRVEGCAVPLVEVDRPEFVEYIRESIAGLPRVTLLVLDDMACPDGWCRAFGSEGLIFRDERHLTTGFVASNWRELEDRLVEAIEAREEADTSERSAQPH